LGFDEKRSLILASKKRISIPKSSGGWGLKIIHLFAQVLAAKNVWGIISNTRLWAHILKEKYFQTESIINWSGDHKNPQKWICYLESHSKCLSPDRKLTYLEGWRW
jgi:hypothetical protein